MNKQIIFLATAVAFLFLISTAHAQEFGSEDTFYDNRDYYIPIYVNQTGSTDVNNALINVTIDTQSLISSGRLDSQCKCLVVTDDLDNVLYWDFESYSNVTYGCNTPNTQLWVQTDIPTTNTTIKIQYDNNASCTWTNNTVSISSDANVIYHFGEESGNITDSSGNGNTGTNNGTTHTDGYFAQGIELDGSDDYIEVPFDPTINPTNELTISFWMNSDDDTKDVFYMSKFKSYLFQSRNPAGEKYIEFFLNTGTTASPVWCIARIGTEQWTSGTWYYVAGTFDGTNQKIYLNGQLMNTTSCSGSVNYDSAYNLYIGNENAGGTTSVYDGKIDELRIWNRSLSADEIKREYEQGLLSFGSEVSSGGPDISPPIITIDSPLNQTYTSVPIDVNITTNENSDWCGFNIDDGSNTTLSNSSLTNWYGTTSPSSGTHRINVYCNDTSGNMGYSYQYFTYNQYPLVTLESPADGTTQESPITFNCSCSDDIELANISLWGNWTQEVSNYSDISIIHRKYLGQYSCAGNPKGIKANDNEVWAVWDYDDDGNGGYDLIKQVYYYKNNTLGPYSVILASNSSSYDNEHAVIAKFGDMYYVFYSETWSGTSYLAYINSSDGITWSSRTILQYCPWDRIGVEVYNDGSDHLVYSCNNTIYRIDYYESNMSFSDKIQIDEGDFTDSNHGLIEPAVWYDSANLYTLYSYTGGTTPRLFTKDNSTDGLNYGNRVTIATDNSGKGIAFHPNIEKFGNYYFLNFYNDSGNYIYKGDSPESVTYWKQFNGSDSATDASDMVKINDTYFVMIYAYYINTNNRQMWTSLVRFDDITFTGEWVIKETKNVTGTWNYSTFTQSLLDGTYKWSCSACDIYGYCNYTVENRTITITTDTTPPSITIYSPQNTTYNTETINLEVSANEAIDTWWYSLNGGANTIFTPNTTITVPEGLNHLEVYANDSAGNMGSSEVYFTYSSPPPTQQTLMQAHPELIILPLAIIGASLYVIFSVITSREISFRVLISILLFALLLVITIGFIFTVPI